MKSVKLETLVINWFKGVKVAEVEFKEDGVNIIGGGNGQAKSAFLHAIQMLLGDKKKYTPSNIHNDDSKGATAKVLTKLNNGLKVERSGKNTALKIIGAPGKTNTEILKEFVNEFALDISKFINASVTEKGKMLISLLGAGDKLQEFDDKIKELEEERKFAGRTAKDKRAHSDNCVRHPGLPEEAADVSKLSASRNQMHAANLKHTANVERIEQVANEGNRKSQEISELKEKLLILELEAENLRSEYKELSAANKAFTPYNLTEIDKQIAESSSLASKIQENKTAEKAAADAEEAEKEHECFDTTIKEVREQRKALLDGVKMPLEGLDIVDGKPIYNGQQWDCMSGSEKIMVAIAISKAYKPECGFVLVDELEQLDWQSIAKLDAYAKKEKLQIIGAMVCEEDKASDTVIIIEDGMVKDTSSK